MSHLTQLVVGGRAYRARPAPESRVLLLEFNVVALDDHDQVATVTRVNNPAVELKLPYRDLCATQAEAIEALLNTTNAYLATLRREADYVMRRAELLAHLLHQERLVQIEREGAYRR